MSEVPLPTPASIEKVREDASPRTTYFDQVPISDTEMRKRILWKLDTRILPALAMMWLSNFIDRSNVGLARIAGLEKDTHLVGNQFNAALSVFFVTFIVFELPSNWILKKVKPNRWLPIIVMAWGIVTMCTGFIKNLKGLYLVRAFLGFCEGGLLPGMLLYLSMIYRREEMQARVGIFYAFAALSGAFGGLLSTAILNLNGKGGLAGWRWIFILEGLATIVVGFICLFILPAGLADAKFLTEEERRFAIARFRSRSDEKPLTNDLESRRTSYDDKGNLSTVDQVSLYTTGDDEEHFEWREVIRGIFDVQVWLTGISSMGIIVSVYSYSLFLPTIIAGLGYKGNSAQLHTVPPYVPAAVLTVMVAFLADRMRWRGPFVLMFLPIAIAGYATVITAKTNSVRYAAVFLMAIGVYPASPCILSIMPNNSSGHYKKATATALQLMIANVGGPIATLIYTKDQAPLYLKGHKIALGFVCLAWALMALNVVYCLWENKARREGRRQKNVDNYRALLEAGKTRAPIGDRSPDFMFEL